MTATQAAESLSFLFLVAGVVFQASLDETAPERLANLVSAVTMYFAAALLLFLTIALSPEELSVRAFQSVFVLLYVIAARETWRTKLAIAASIAFVLVYTEILFRLANS